VSDEFGGVIVGATVLMTDANGVAKTATTNGEGNYSIAGLTPGKYSMQVTAAGFATYENGEVELVAGRSEPVNVILKVTIEQQKVTVSADTTGVNTDPESRRDVLKEQTSNRSG
jgi:hypothetical protein